MTASQFYAQADPAGYGGPPGTQVVGERKGAVVSRGDDHEVLKVRFSC